MRKSLLSALVVIAIVGCSQNEEIENAGQKAEIKFGTVVSTTTRAAITDLNTLKVDGFTVYAYNTGTNTVGSATLGTVFMPGLAVTYADPNWTFTGTYYWPLTDNIQFFAYATDAAAKYAVGQSDKYPTIDYTVAATAANQKDFVVAKATDKTKNSSAVTLEFTHALTQVNFSAKGTAGLTYKITSVKLAGVYSTGKYNFETDTWSTLGTDVSYDYPIAVGGASITGDATAKLDQTNGALMLMPQSMSANSKIIISYEVYAANVMIDQVTDAEISLEGTSAWETGKKVRYTLTLTAAGATVQFAPSVGPWNDADDTSVEK